MAPADAVDEVVWGEYPVWGDPQELAALVGHDIPDLVWRYAPLFGSRILVVREKARDVTESGIYKPETREDLTHGWILAAGPRALPDHLQGVGFSREALIGAKVNFGGYCGTGLTGDDDHPRLFTLYLVMDMADVWGLDGDAGVGQLKVLHYATPAGVVKRHVE